MLSLNPSLEIKKPPKQPPDSLLKPNSLNSVLLQPLHHYPRTCLVIAILSFQFLLLLHLRSGSIPFTRPQYDAVSLPPSAATDDSESDPCRSGRVYVYELPEALNKEILANCDKLTPWGSRCDSLSNSGFGPIAVGLSGLVPDRFAPAWFWTDQFATEVIFHNRIMNHRCRVSEPESATAFYIPFYAGLALGKYLWLKTSTSEDKDRHCKMMLTWLNDQPYYKRSDGWDHFISMGRISWDFRRWMNKNKDWGSSCIYQPGMRNITRLLIERNPWDYFDVGVPYPTGFHPRSPSELSSWQDFVRSRHRSTLFSFAGATRRAFRDDFRGLLLSHCANESESCRVVDCAGSRCSNGAPAILRAFLGSEFCLQPRGDSFTRRSIFDCMIAGSIPVFFWKRTAYYQYEWFLPHEPGSYSVYVDRNAVKNGTVSVKAVLESYSQEEKRKMREKLIEYIPRLVYSQNQEGLGSFKDAFDIAIDGVFRRFKEQEQDGYKW